MIRVEIKKLLKEGAVFLFVLLVVFAAMLITDKEDYLAPPLELSLILFSSFIGWSMFDRERQEGAMEYLLSLPVSRSRLLFIKFIPRTVYITIILLLYHFIHSRFETHFLLTFYNFVLFFLTVYLLSASFSLSIKSFLGTFFLSIFLSNGLYFLIRYLDWSRDESSAAVQAALSLLLIPVLFFLLFHLFDMKPLSYFNIKFIPSLLVAVLLLFGITYMTTGVEWTACHLTKDGYLLKVTRKKTVLVNGDKQQFIFSKRLEPILQDQGKLYAGLRLGNTQPGQLLRLDLKTGKVEDIYRPDPGWWFHTFTESAVKTGENFYFLLTDEKHNRYRLVELAGNRVREIDIKAGFFDKEYIHLFHGAADNPRQFFVFTDSADGPSRVFRIFESGDSEFLFEADAICMDRNKLVRFTPTELTVYRVGEELTGVFRKKGEIRILKRRFDNIVPRKPLVKIDNIIYLFDIETETFSRVNIRSLPYDYMVSEKDDGVVMVFVSGSEISFSELKDGRLRPGKVWFSKIDPDELRIIRVFSSGVTITAKENNEIYFFNGAE